jgi:hypothetical protein
MAELELVKTKTMASSALCLFFRREIKNNSLLQCTEELESAKLYQMVPKDFIFGS